MLDVDLNNDWSRTSTRLGLVPELKWLAYVISGVRSPIINHVTHSLRRMAAC